MSAIKQIVGDRVKTLRIAKKWTQAVLAKRSGFDESYIDVLERGQANPSLSTIVALADALDVEPHELLRDSESNVD